MFLTSKMSRFYAVMGLMAALIQPSWAQPSPSVTGITLDESVLAALPLRSQATATWLFIDVYKAALYAPQTSKAQSILDDSTPLKLKLCYLHKITKDEFVEAASKALPAKLTPSLQSAVNGLHQAYRDVKPDDCYQLSYSAQQGVVLSLNDVPVYQDKTPGFKALYFGIWLGKEPLSETVKETLLEPL
ncbi:hypothetical protein THMIRHAS_21610 [Thiosulfatimonas sediminis]|uniref:Chalcone isomerase domain-containing protein n=1 Tax=Thiosulfatimonas sediminis TaxID=2675054 RepID=A0A6F8PXR9_9GAMM|nr:chalcone isomerase family protein [Thiosulfatimonas sediminis]BBP46788.1 hypothetical protein THMIRHAS_21610 [Thiosulfatimonas sediminis]